MTEAGMEVPRPEGIGWRVGMSTVNFFGSVVAVIFGIPVTIGLTWWVRHEISKV